MKARTKSRHRKKSKSNRIIRFIQVIAFLWVFIGLITVLVTALGALKTLNVPYIIRMVSYGLALLLSIFLISVITRHLLPGISKSLKSHLSKIGYRQVVYLSAILTSLILILFVNETYLRFFSTPVYQDTEYLVNSAWNHLNVKFFNKSGRSSSAHEYQDIDNSMTIQSHIYSTEGRFERTVRWHRVIAPAEIKYQIPSCLLAGLIMQESMGNPLQVNSSNDGGGGLMMFQPGTARQYGLRTFGTAQGTGPDSHHGQVIVDMLAAEKYNYDNIRKLDERFDIEKSIYTGAQYLRELYERYGTWDKAISAYNRGTPALIPTQTKHVRMVKCFQHYYCQNRPDYSDTKLCPFCLEPLHKAKILPVRYVPVFRK